MKDKVLRNVYETTCSRCHRKFQVHRYIHRLEIHELDIDDFRPLLSMYECCKRIYIRKR